MGTNATPLAPPVPVFDQSYHHRTPGTVAEGASALDGGVFVAMPRLHAAAPLSPPVIAPASPPVLPPPPPSEVAPPSEPAAASAPGPLPAPESPAPASLPACTSD